MQFAKKKHYRTDELYGMANEMRKDLIKMLVKAGSGHSAGPLGMMEIFTALYFHILNHNPKRLDWGERDCFVVPAWARHSHANGSGSEAAVLFAVDDAPALRALGLYRQDPATDGPTSNG